MASEDMDLIIEQENRVITLTPGGWCNVCMKKNNTTQICVGYKGLGGCHTSSITLCDECLRTLVELAQYKGKGSIHEN